MSNECFSPLSKNILGMDLKASGNEKHIELVIISFAFLLNVYSNELYMRMICQDEM